MKKMLNLGLLLLPLLFLPSCWLKDKLMGKKTETASVAPGSDSLAKEGQSLVSMDGQVIISEKMLDRDFEQFLEENPQFKAVAQVLPDAKSNFLQGMVSQAIIDRYVEENKLDQSSEYQQDLTRLVRSFKRMLNTKYFGAKHAADVTDQEITNFYENNKSTVDDLVVSRGGVKAVGIAFNNDQEAKAFAAKAKGNDFAKTAKEANLTAKIQDFKLVNDKTMGIDNAVKKNLLAKKAVGISVVKGDDKKVWVTNVTEVKETTYQPLAQVKTAIKQYLEKEKRVAALDKEIGRLKDKYKVVVNDAYFKAKDTAQVADQGLERDEPQKSQETRPTTAAKVA